MKKSFSSTILWFLVGASALISVWLCYTQIKYTREIRALQRQVLVVNQENNRLKGLLTDLVAYSKTSPDIEPLLRPFLAQPVKQ